MSFIELQNVPIKLGHQEFGCPFCPKTTLRKDHMQNHIVTHTGERAYKCSYCPKAYTVYRSLFRHIKTTHELME